MSANKYGIIAVTGRAHCQRQVAFFYEVQIVDREVITIYDWSRGGGALVS